MAGIAILLDLYKKKPSFCSPQSFHSSGLFSASTAASAAATVAAGSPFASRFLFGYIYCKSVFMLFVYVDAMAELDFGIAQIGFMLDYPKVSHCDAGAVLPEHYISNTQRSSEDFFKNDALKYSVKEYKIELKPLFSAFELRPFALTTLRSFLLFYLPLLEPSLNIEEDEEDFPQDSPEERRVDLVVPLKKSVKQIIRETTVVTTRRILERLAVIYVSQRMAWKLLKDVPKSAVRKSQRGMPATVYFFRVSRTTFRGRNYYQYVYSVSKVALALLHPCLFPNVYSGHLLGVTAAWIVQTGIEIYRCFSRRTNSDESNEANVTVRAKLLGKKISGITIRCGASLIFASIGAGICATLFRPSVGQWIGCAAGDLAGPIIVSVCLEKVFHVDL
ncbi:Isopentenyl-diphosphate delta-isomerase [Gossypium australe]|uniref:Isopentenyl-diphosphate delta-isomerase n=1 Tax=Gossypium australe TaxID=47621 RepID=A0A5B6VDT6_9ROSI|nr:Isopentenyl-diphosphate delta-isomerase [Gossypium australe]